MAKRSTQALTKSIIRNAPAPDPSGKQVVHWDEEVTGFGLLCSGTTSQKSFVVQTANRHGIPRRTIQRLDLLPADYKLDDIRRQAQQAIVDIQNGIDPRLPKVPKSDADMTLSEALEGYIRAKKNLAERSKEEYRKPVNRWLADWKDKPLRRITPQMVEDRHAEIAEEVRASGKGNGGASADAAVRVLRLVWNYAAPRVRDLGPNPAKLEKDSWFRPPPRDKVVRSAEMQQFVAATLGLSNKVLRDYVLLLTFTGLRREEAAGLTWSHIDFDEGFIRFKRGETKAKRRTFDLPMSDVVRDILMERRSNREKDNDHVFPSYGKSGRLAEPKTAFREIAEASAIVASPHVLRHTLVTEAGRAGIPHRRVKALVNHSVSNGNDVTAGYDHFDENDLRADAQTLADRLKVLAADRFVISANGDVHGKAGTERAGRRKAEEVAVKLSAPVGLWATLTMPWHEYDVKVDMIAPARNVRYAD